MKKLKNVSLCLSVLLIFSLLVSCKNKDTASSNDETKKTSTIETIQGNQTQAVDFSSKPIQMICPVKAGGDTDYNTRMIAKYLEQALNTSVVVTNVEGGATIVGMRQVLDAPADGHTIVINGLDGYIPKLMGTTDIDLNTFKTVGIPLFDNCTVLVANTNSNYKGLVDVVEQSKEKDIEYGMKIGAANQLYGVAMNEKWGSQFKAVDVGNNAAKVTALLGEQTDVCILTYALAEDAVKEGNFQILTLLGKEHNRLLPPEIKIPSDEGLQDIDCSKWFWLGVHPDTPDNVVNALEEGLKTVTENPDFIKTMEERYLTVKWLGSEEAQKYANDFFNDTLVPYADSLNKK